MGKVRRLLFSKKLASAAPAMYADKRAIEAAETMHFHERNVRLEYSPVEMRDLRSAFSRIAPHRVCLTSGPTYYLSLLDIAPSPDVTPRRFDIEESEYPTLPETTIHIHYRSLRLEFTHDEWNEFRAGVAAASAAWEGGNGGEPVRDGQDHPPP